MYLQLYWLLELSIVKMSTVVEGVNIFQIQKILISIVYLENVKKFIQL